MSTPSLERETILQVFQFEEVEFPCDWGAGKYATPGIGCNEHARFSGIKVCCQAVNLRCPKHITPATGKWFCVNCGVSRGVDDGPWLVVNPL